MEHQMILGNRWSHFIPNTLVEQHRSRPAPKWLDLIVHSWSKESFSMQEVDEVKAVYLDLCSALPGFGARLLPAILTGDNSLVKLAISLEQVWLLDSQTGEVIGQCTPMELGQSKRGNQFTVGKEQIETDCIEEVMQLAFWSQGL
jgi:hypothetical protein